MIREIDVGEVNKLIVCIMELSEHHNQISQNFKGHYPSRPYEITLSVFEKCLLSGTSHIAVVENDSEIMGFCKVDITEKVGKLDYLIVLQEYRNRGVGKQLMSWAMRTFETNHISDIEVKVVDGNDAAIHLYEKYGFRMNAHILKRCSDLKTEKI